MLQLSDILTRAIDWVKYAEAKNAAIIVFDSSILVALITLSSGKENNLLLPNWYVTLSTILLICAAVSSLISFIPILAKFKIKNDDGTDITKINPLYFGDIAKFDEVTYLSLLANRYGPLLYDNYNKDIANQIIINSKIAVRKLNIFTIALWLNLFVFLSSLIFLIPLYWRQ